MNPAGHSKNPSMKILISANSFYPSVGGYERVALIVAQELASRGHQIRIITSTASKDEETNLPFKIYRNPSIRKMLKLIRWSDVYVQNNVSFKLLWPILFCWRPLVCVHHGFYRSSKDKNTSWRWRLKHLVTRFSTNISVSQAVANSIPGNSFVSLNPYREEDFFRMPNVGKTRDLFFVGRVVSDKGIDVLVDAVAKLKEWGLLASLTVAGSGPEEQAIRKRVNELGLNDLVKFAGRISDSELNELLNLHRIMVVPTREGEGFGVVALEGIACGCVVVGSTCGGLPEAIGPCGRTFPNGNSIALAQVLRDLLSDSEACGAYLAHAKSHLDAHRPSVVANRYMEVLGGVKRR